MDETSIVMMIIGLILSSILYQLRIKWQDADPTPPIKAICM